MQKNQSHRFCVAPMMDGTDRHCRYFHRLLSRHARLYSEMVTADAVVHGDRNYLLGYSPEEHPLALQLGGSDPAQLAAAAKIGEDFGYDEINLNVGCPSDRVQSGSFGACLMKRPELVARCVERMSQVVTVPVTVKCRLGVDDQDPEVSLFELVERCVGAGCSTFIVHARKAWLKGLSPKENRTVPPLDYDIVFRLKAAYPDLTIVLNGGIESVSESVDHIERCDGVMLGRAAYGSPFILSTVDQEIFQGVHHAPERSEIVLQMSAYLKRQLQIGVRPHSITRHMLGLFHRAPGARSWRRYLSEHAPALDGRVLDDALAEVQAAAAKVS